MTAHALTTPHTIESQKPPQDDQKPWDERAWAGHQRVPMHRLVRVEIIKMFNTRSGFWLMASVVLLSLVAVTTVIVVGPDSAITQGNFNMAVGAPIAIILPIAAVLAVTSEYSQRTTLNTYTLVARRGHVLFAKAVAVIGVGVLAIAVACAVGALGHWVGSTVRGVDTVWQMSALDFAHVILGNVIGMMMGFALGVLLRNSPAAVVAYLVYSLVLPNLFGTLAFFREGFHDVWPWVDLSYNATSLFGQSPSAEGWLQLAVTALVWLGLPLLVGTRLVLRAEVK